jgi:hypothetical protein
VRRKKHLHNKAFRLDHRDVHDMPDMKPLDTSEVAATLENRNTDNTNVAKDESNTFRGNNGVNSRRRSLSMASAPPSVETVVVKAKRAATSLWMLLHAQVRARVGSRRDLFSFSKTSHD